MTHPLSAALLEDVLDQLRAGWPNWFPGIRQPRSLSYVIQGTGVGKLIIFILGQGTSQPVCLLKLPRSRRDNASLAQEHSLILELRRRGGRVAQATLPEPVAAPVIQGWQVVVEKMLPGSLFSNRVPTGARFALRTAAQHLRMIREWLVALQKSVYPRSDALRPDEVNNLFIQPIEQAQRELEWRPHERQYLYSACETARNLVGKQLPVSFVHGDLRPGNLLMWQSQLSVLDWQFGQLRGLPMLDWFEFAFRYYCDTANLAEITGDYEAYRTAFAHVFLGAHPYTQVVMEETKACADDLGVGHEHLELLLKMWLIDNANKYLRFLSDRAEHGYLYLMQNLNDGTPHGFRHQLRRQVYPCLLGLLAQNTDALQWAVRPRARQSWAGSGG